jgi:SAM-dependent methyltransferase
VRADAAALPLVEGAAGVVTATLALQHVPDPARVLAEAHRVVRPGGVLAVVEPDHLAIDLAFGDDDLAELVKILRDEGRLVLDEEEAARSEPQIICSLGLV